jgi:hypothetical protein
MDRCLSPDRRAKRDALSAFGRGLAGMDSAAMAESMTKLIAEAVSCQALTVLSFQNLMEVPPW